MDVEVESLTQHWLLTFEERDAETTRFVVRRANSFLSIEFCSTRTRLEAWRTAIDRLFRVKNDRGIISLNESGRVWLCYRRFVRVACWLRMREVKRRFKPWRFETLLNRFSFLFVFKDMLLSCILDDAKNWWWTDGTCTNTNQFYFCILVWKFFSF